MVVIDGDFGSCLDHEGGALMSGICAHVKVTPQVPSIMWTHARGYQLEAGRRPLSHYTHT